MLSIPSLCMTFTTFTQIIDEATLGKLFSSASQIRFGLHLFINYFKIIWPPFWWFNTFFFYLVINMKNDG